MKPIFVLLLALSLGACTFDEDPDFFIDNMRPDLYFALKQPDGAIAASVAFTTKKPTSSMPLNVRVLAWGHEGDNIYQGTLEETLLDNPSERKGLLQWSGTVAFPTGMIPGDDPFAQYIGIELRTFMPIAAFNGPPQAGDYCEADLMGAGITACGPWFSVYAWQWAVCRGAAGQLVDCDDLHYILLPSIYARGIAKRTSRANAMSRPGAPSESLSLYTSDLYLYEAPDGWRYMALSPLDFLPHPGTFSDRIAGRHSHGPFATAEQAARDAVTELGIKPGWYAGFADMVAQYAQGTEVHRAATVLEELLHVGDGSDPALPTKP